MQNKELWLEDKFWYNVAKMKAVVEITGHQHLVQAGDELLVDRLSSKKGEKISLDKVLLIFNEKKIEIGNPFLKGAAVEAKVLGHLKGNKIRVARFKAKSRYRRVKGFRAALTKIKIGKIKTNG